MYQLAPERRVDRTSLFIETCTSMQGSADNLNMIRSTAKLMRVAVATADLEPLKEFMARAEEWCVDIDDVLAAAGQVVVDEYDHLPHQQLHDVIRRVADIERTVLNPARPQRDTFRTVYAG
jgi:hypothetical protein